MQLLKEAGLNARVEDGSFIYKMLAHVGITNESRDETLRLIDAVVAFLTQVSNSAFLTLRHDGMSDVACYLL